VCVRQQLNYSVGHLLGQANEFYNCQGINFWMEGSYRQWVLVVDIMAAQSSAFGYDLQQQPPDFPYAYSSTVNPTTNSPAAAYQPYSDYLAD
jgi:hypothetical protein